MTSADLEDSSGAIPQPQFSKPLPLSSTCHKVGVDLTWASLQKEHSAVLGREKEVERLILLLTRPGQRSVILTGEPGVGKTVLVEELAHRIAAGKVPKALAGRRLIQTTFSDIWSRVGNSDNWAGYMDLLRGLLREVAEMNAILFMDEFHMIAGHQYSMSYIRPPLARGELTIIGATTDQEYFTYLERDQTTMRRFQTLRIEETDEGTTVSILKETMKGPLYGDEQNSIDDDDLRFLVRLSNAYIPYSFQPSKALDILSRAVSTRHFEGDRLTRKDFQKAVCESVGIPEEAIEAPAERLAAMEDVLNRHILGQREAISKLCRRLFISKTAVSVTPDRPHGVFLLAGPTGVGKTELAKALAAFLTGNEKNLIRLDMNAYTTSDSVHSIIGTPGSHFTGTFREVPLLTRLIRTRPHSVLLLDEIEKAHPMVRLLFLHAIDTGRMRDNLGNELILSRMVVIMTTNAGFSEKRAVIGITGKSESELMREDERGVKASLESSFPPEFLGRIDEILFFKPLTQEVVRGFVGQKVRLLETLTGKKIELTSDAVKLISSRGFHPQYGARDLNRTMDEFLGYPIARLKLSDVWRESDMIHVTLAAGGTTLEARMCDGAGDDSDKR